MCPGFVNDCFIIIASDECYLRPVIMAILKLISRRGRPMAEIMMGYSSSYTTQCVFVLL